MCGSARRDTACGRIVPSRRLEISAAIIAQTFRLFLQQEGAETRVCGSAGVHVGLEHQALVVGGGGGAGESIALSRLEGRHAGSHVRLRAAVSRDASEICGAGTETVGLA
jgi:hypothetical protein